MCWWSIPFQTMYVDTVESAPGTVTQVRTAAQELIRMTKRLGTTFFVGHVTKTGQIAGPVFWNIYGGYGFVFRGDRGHQFRILRTVKNRFGATDEIGVFEMGQLGLSEVAKSFGFVFCPNVNRWCNGFCCFAGMEGTRPLLVEVQALVVAGGADMVRRRSVIGWDQNRLSMILAVLEARCGLMFSGSGVSQYGGGIALPNLPANLRWRRRDQRVAGRPVRRNMVFLVKSVYRVKFALWLQPDHRLKEAAKRDLPEVYCRAYLFAKNQCRLRVFRSLKSAIWIDCPDVTRRWMPSLNAWYMRRLPDTSFFKRFKHCLQKAVISTIKGLRSIKLQGFSWRISVLVDIGVILVLLISAGVSFSRSYSRSLTIVGVMGALAALIFVEVLSRLTHGWFGIKDGVDAGKLFDILPMVWLPILRLTPWCSLVFCFTATCQLLLSSSAHGWSWPIDRTRWGFSVWPARGVLLLGLIYLPFYLILPEDNKKNGCPMPRRCLCRAKFPNGWHLICRKMGRFPMLRMMLNDKLPKLMFGRKDFSRIKRSNLPSDGYNDRDRDGLILYWIKSSLLPKTTAGQKGYNE